MRWAIVFTAVAVAFLYFLYTGIVAAVSSLSVPAPAATVASGVAPVQRPVATSTLPRSPDTIPASLPSTPKVPVAQRPVDRGIAVPSFARPEQTQRINRAQARDFRRQVVAALSEFKSRLATCPDSGIHGGFGSEISEGERAGVPAALVLELATRDGSVEILDVPREKRGRGSADFMACARTVLHGRVIPVEAARAGARMHISVHLGAL